MAKNENYDDEEMTVEISLDDGTVVNCAVIAIYPVEDNDYIALLPLDENGDNEDGEVWIYGYSENPDDPNEEPELTYIEDDELYERVADAFDEYLDQCEIDADVEEEEYSFHNGLRKIDKKLWRSIVPQRARSSRFFFALVMAT